MTYMLLFNCALKLVEERIQYSLFINLRFISYANTVNTELNVIF